MKDEHKISFIAIGYGVILTLLTFIFYEKYVTWALLGSLTAMFNHSQMLQVTKGETIQTYKLATHLVTRFTMYLIMIVIVFLQLRENQEEMITALIILLLGFSALKVSAIVYTLPFFKKQK